MRTLLVVDDDRMQRKLLDDCLRGSGYTVLLACNGIEAISTVTKVKVDVILLDLNMPEMDGWQVAVHIKEFIDIRMPIIVISSYCLPGDRARAQAAGCVDLVRKPVELTQLYALIDDVLVDCETPFGR
ncbi:MAG: response regulator [Pirellulaceae bacterium]|nr:response regulator [Pirellulaceae bacterium]